LIEFAQAFLGQIVAMLPSLDAMKRQLDRETGRRFCAFNIFNTDEPATSRVLAFLFNPKETHGQGDLFLRLFVERFVPEWKDVFRYDEAKPASTGQKIDATLSDGTHWLGIENKVFNAHEQSGQVDRYLCALKARAHSENYRLIYLSPEGALPSTFSFTDAGKIKYKGKLVGGAWVQNAASENGQPVRSITTPMRADILDWLGDCRKECRPENIRWFLQQFMMYVYSLLSG
jgi:PD-(D/E)XK nuclease superfamily